MCIRDRFCTEWEACLWSIRHCFVCVTEQHYTTSRFSNFDQLVVTNIQNYIEIICYRILVSYEDFKVSLFASNRRLLYKINKTNKDIIYFRYKYAGNLFQWNESWGVSGTNTWTTVTNWFVGHWKFSKIMTNHLRLKNNKCNC